MPTRAGIEKGKHAMLMFLVVVLAVVFRFYGEDMVVDLELFEVGCNTSYMDHCMGNQAVYRLSFTLFVFFLALTCVGYFGLELGWWIKNPMFVLLGIVPFFMPNDFFSGYAEFARVLSAVFLVLQILILVEFAYDLNDYFLRHMGVEDPGAQERKEWKVLYLVLCLGLLAASYAGVAVMYDEYGECSSGQSFASITVVFGTVLTGLSVSTVCNKGLLTPVVVFCYLTYLCWQALSSHPDPKCNPSAGDHDDGGTSILLGLLVTAGSLTWSSWRTSERAPDVFRTDDSREKKNDIELSNVLAGGSGGKAGDAEAPAASSPGSQIVQPVLPWQFFAVMCLGGAYLAMLVSDWSDTDGTPEAANFTTSMESMWVKVISQWLTILLYGWTLLAPVLLPGRDFS